MIKQRVAEEAPPPSGVRFCRVAERLKTMGDFKKFLSGRPGYIFVVPGRKLRVIGAPDENLRKRSHSSVG